MNNLLNVVLATTNIASDIEKGILGLQDTIISIANPIAVFSVVCIGVYMLFGSNPQTIQKCKSWAFSILFGLLLINLAKPIIDWVSALVK